VYGFGRIDLQSAHDFVTNSGMPPYLLTSQSSGGGTVTSLDGKVACGSACLYAYMPDSPVILQALPVSGWYFYDGWTGCDSSIGAACTVTMGRSKEVTARFTTVPPITLWSSGQGYATITEALTGAVDYDIVRVQAVSLAETVLLTFKGTITVRGGYDPSFSNSVSMSRIIGSVSITEGPVILENLLIQ
jgi:hypothetical protein